MDAIVIARIGAALLLYAFGCLTAYHMGLRHRIEDFFEFMAENCPLAWSVLCKEAPVIKAKWRKIWVEKDSEDAD